VGYESYELEWQALLDIPTGSRYFVNEHSAQMRREQQAGNILWMWGRKRMQQYTQLCQ
jgi:hypothetical protein